MIKTLPISEARKEINNIATTLEREDTISVTSRGREVLAILPWETYEAITETLEIMSDPDMMHTLKQSIEEYKSGKTEDWEDVKKELGLV
jgi:prevent-host-death family protein